MTLWNRVLLSSFGIQSLFEGLLTYLLEFLKRVPTYIIPLTNFFGNWSKYFYFPTYLPILINLPKKTNWCCSIIFTVFATNHLKNGFRSMKTVNYVSKVNWKCFITGIGFPTKGTGLTLPYFTILHGLPLRKSQKCFVIKIITPGTFVSCT